MAAILVPGIDPDLDEELRDRWRLAPNDPVPVSGEKMLLQPDRARKMELLRACPAVPAGGPGKAKLDAIVGEARRIGKIHDPNVGLEAVAAGTILARNSRTGGKWDIKNLKDSTGRKRYPDAREFGDFLYGATSTGMGFSPAVSDMGADAYSLLTNATLEDKDDWIRAGQRYAGMKCDQR